MTATSSVAADPWLSTHLGVPAFHLVPGLPIEIPASPCFVDAKVPADAVDAVSALEDAGFHVVDTAITLERSDRSVAQAPGDVGLALATDEDRVAEIASSALTRSRFHLDPEIPDSVASSIKAAWVRSHFGGTRGDWMVVARVDGAVVGFTLLLERPDATVIDLIAVEGGHRGAGIGRAMIGWAAATCGAAPALRVGTQAANVPSLRFYESLGFRVARTEHVLHRHVRA